MCDYLNTKLPILKFNNEYVSVIRAPQTSVCLFCHLPVFRYKYTIKMEIQVM